MKSRPLYTMFLFFFQAEDGIRDWSVTGVQTCALPICRFMDVEARVGNYKLDSSNFIGDEGFRGFSGSTGSVGIDRDYDSLRQDLWIATDQAFKEAVETYSRKQAYLSSLARQSDIDDFSKAQPVKIVEPLVTPDWTNRTWA